MDESRRFLGRDRQPRAGTGVCSWLARLWIVVGKDDVNAGRGAVGFGGALLGGMAGRTLDPVESSVGPRGIHPRKAGSPHPRGGGVWLPLPGGVRKAWPQLCRVGRSGFTERLPGGYLLAPLVLPDPAAACAAACVQV